jgi:hypothetical protein
VDITPSLWGRDLFRSIGGGLGGGKKKTAAIFIDSGEPWAKKARGERDGVAALLVVCHTSDLGWLALAVSRIIAATTHGCPDEIETASSQITCVTDH